MIDGDRIVYSKGYDIHRQRLLEGHADHGRYHSRRMGRSETSELDFRLTPADSRAYKLDSRCQFIGPVWQPEKHKGA